jgi:hypothetical protein
MLAQMLDLVVQLADLFAYLGNGYKNALQRWPKFSRHILFTALGKAVGTASGQALTVGFNHSSRMAD